MQHSFAVRLRRRGNSPIAAHSHFAALRVKDAVVDSFMRHQGSRPDVDTAAPYVRLHVLVADVPGSQAVSVSLSLEVSAGSLHRRGYRQQSGEAPLKENLAAALLRRSGWPQQAPLLDPMCGSGTLLIEAAHLALQLPGTGSCVAPLFADLAPTRLAELRAAASAQRAAILQRRDDALPQLHGADADARAVRAARDNIAAAGLSHLIQVRHCDLRTLRPPTPGVGQIICNLPYGERLQEQSTLRALYAQVGGCLRAAIAGWTAHLLVSDREAAHALGLRAHRLHSFYNGPLPCTLLHIEVPQADTAEPPRQALHNRLRKNSTTATCRSMRCPSTSSKTATWWCRSTRRPKPLRRRLPPPGSTTCCGWSPR